MPTTQVQDMPKKKGEIGLWLTILLGLLLVVGFGLMLYDILLG